MLVHSALLGGDKKKVPPPCLGKTRGQPLAQSTVHCSSIYQSSWGPLCKFLPLGRGSDIGQWVPTHGGGGTKAANRKRPKRRWRSGIGPQPISVTRANKSQ